MIYDCIIVGGGPAGLTAGLYLARANKKVLILEKYMAGGQVAEIALIENYPGVQKVSGSDLAMSMYSQAKEFGVEFKFEEALSYELNGDIKKVNTRKSVFEAKTIVFAIGSKAKTLNLEKEKAFVGKGVSYCATCDGSFFKNKNVAVVGDGNSATSSIQYLSGIAKKVYAISNKKRELLKTLNFSDNVKIILEADVVDILGNEKVEGLKLIKSGQEQKLEVEGIFVTIGRTPDTQILKGIVELDKDGYIIADKNMCTNVAGVFVAGDVLSGALKQIVSASSYGAIASTSVIKYLANK